MRRTNPDRCIIEGCPSVGRLKVGLCPKHYTRKRKYGSPTAATKRAGWGESRMCSVAGCDRTYIKGDGLCGLHYQRRAHKARPDQFSDYTRKRRALRRAAVVSAYSPADVALRMAYFGSRCWMCGGPFECVDHVKPLAAGGRDCPANFRPACGSCNSAKGAKWYGVANLHRFLRVPKAA